MKEESVKTCPFTKKQTKDDLHTCGFYGNKKGTR